MRDIPLFPEKRALGLDDKPFLDVLFEKYPPVVSEMTFSNLFAWRHAYGFCLSRIGETVCVVCEEKAKMKMFDPWASLEAKRDVFRRAFELENTLELIRLPEETVDVLRSDPFFSIHEDRDQFDYVYRSRDLANLSGKAYDAKRNFMRRFREQNLFEFQLLEKEHIRECLFFEEEWCQARDCQGTESLARERRAVHEMLTHFEPLGVSGALIRIQGKIEAVTLGEALNRETFVIHIEKANNRTIGIYQAINQMFSQWVESLGYAWINREQDLGVLGLRRAKESYHPAFLVKKFSVSAG